MRFDEKFIPEPNSGCWIWLAHCLQFGPGYGQIWWDSRMLMAHRVSWILHYGDIPDNLRVLHKCDVPPCVNPHHLFLGTLKDNTQDMIKKGRQRFYMKSGELNHQAKLSNLQVVEIRSLNLSGQEIANRYGINRNYVYDIRAGRERKNG